MDQVVGQALALFNRLATPAVKASTETAGQGIVEQLIADLASEPAVVPAEE